MIYTSLVKFQNYFALIKANESCINSISFTSFNIKTKPNELSTNCALELNKYFNAQAYDFSNIPIDLSHLSPFTQEVLNELKNIPFGECISYKDLGFNINSKAYRAIGTALSKNPYLILLPCHRVIKSNANLGNFTCEIEGMKEILFKHEQKYKSKFAF